MATQKIKLKGLAAASADCKEAAKSTEAGPAPLKSLAEVKAALKNRRDTLPAIYRESFYDPLLSTVNRLTPGDFLHLQQNPDQTPFWDAMQAVTQNATGYEALATDAYQEVVADLYDGFLSAEDRVGVKPPDFETLPPLVKWGNPEYGPYTWPIDAMSSLGCRAAIVSLPPANAKSGLLAWAALAHETAGHDLMAADEGLTAELIRVTHKALLKAKQPAWMADYWATRMDETGSDVLGVINMGPAAGIGLIGYFRGLMAAWTGSEKLRSDGPANDSHPADIVRGYLAAATVRRLSFSGAQAWAAAIEAETVKDITQIRLAGHLVTPAQAKKAAGIVAAAIADTPLKTLENHSLRSIQDWRDTDEAISAALRAQLVSGVSTLPDPLPSTAYATHAVAAAVTAAVLGEATPQALFGPMLGMLKIMHDTNPSWGPLFLTHRSDAGRHWVALRS